MLSSVSHTRNRIFYGWVVVVAIIANGFIMMGVNSSFGVFFKPLANAFHLTRATTSAVLSARMAFSGVFAVLGGWAIDRYGPRLVFSTMGFFIGLSLILTSLSTTTWQLFVTHSLLLAIGVGASYVVMTSTVLRWFERKRGLALGVAGVGGGLGTASLAPLSAFLIESFDWPTALMILGGISWLVTLSASQFMKKDPYEIGVLPDGATSPRQTSTVEQGTVQPSDLPLIQILQTKSFWAFLFIWLLMAFSGFFIMTHIVPHATDLGFSAAESATILSLAGIAMIGGRLITGIMLDRISARTVAVVYSLFQATALLWLIWGQELWTLYLFGLIHGFTFGGFGTTMTILIGRTFSLQGIGKILGVLEIGIFIGAAIGPLLGGFIFDTSHSYTLAFLIMAGVVLIRTLLVVTVRQEARKD